MRLTFVLIGVNVIVFMLQASISGFTNIFADPTALTLVLVYYKGVIYGIERADIAC